MPLYEYTCLECGARFDAFRSMKDADTPIACKNCHSQQTKRALSLFYASSEGRAVTSTSNSCAGCAGGSCSSCSH